MKNYYQSAKISGMAIGATLKKYVEIDDEKNLIDLLSQLSEKSERFRVIGGGNNVIFGGSDFDGTVIKYSADEINIEGNLLVAQSGADWDQIVEIAVDNNLSGIEALSLVPGTLGGAVVQNIGAYGQDLAGTCHWVRVYDCQSDSVRKISPKGCKFGYRSSIFKVTDEQPMVILSAGLMLSKEPTTNPETSYAQIREALGAESDNYTPDNVRKLVLKIRRNKFPDPVQWPSCGSFFKNPVVNQSQFQKIYDKYSHLLKPGEIIGDKADDGQLKLRLAFIFDRMLNLKGYREYGFMLSTGNPLIVINAEPKSDKSPQERWIQMQNLIKSLQSKVDASMGEGVIALTPEPDLIT